MTTSNESGQETDGVGKFHREENNRGVLEAIAVDLIGYSNTRKY